MLFYCLWIPAVIIYYIICAVLSKRLNDDGSWRHFFSLIGLQAFGLWPWVARYSQRLIFDGLLFDAVIFVTYLTTLIILGAGEDFSTIQWIGCGVVFAGMLMLKLG